MSAVQPSDCLVNREDLG